MFGEVKFVLVETDLNGCTCQGWLWCYGGIDPLNYKEAKGILFHELGHKFLEDLGVHFTDINLSLGFYEDDRHIQVTGIHHFTGSYERTALDYTHTGQPFEQHNHALIQYNTYKEDFADTFMNWMLDLFSDDEVSRSCRVWMEDFIHTHRACKPNRRPHAFRR